MTDITIIGAGPAGSILASRLSKQFSVTIIEKRPNFRDLSQNISQQNCQEQTAKGKSCGGLLAPDAAAMLGKLDIGIPQSVLCGPQVFQVRSIDAVSQREKTYLRHYINMDRERFDRYLFSLSGKNVTLHDSSVVTEIRQNATGWNIKWIQAGIIHQINSKIVIGADGAGSKLRQQLSPTKNKPAYCTIQGFFRSENTPPRFSAFFDQNITDYYGWVIPKLGYFIAGAAFKREPGAERKFRQFLEHVKKAGYDCSKPCGKEGALLHRPTARDLCLGKASAALTGEAAGLISPSSAEGLSFALESSRILANSINQKGDQFLSHYKKGIKKLKLKIAVKRLKSPFIYNPLLRNLIMKSGISSLKKS